jgi:hypothetical protein
MTIANTITAKFAVATVAVAMALSAFAAPAQAQTTEELQQMINDLLAQVAQLQGQVGGDAPAAAAGVCPYTWTRDLSQGSEGMDVMKLQQFLNSDPDTRVAAEGMVGGPGMETEYYGPATAAAVSKMQVKYRSEVLSPAGLVNPTGYFGPSSRAKANSVCVAAPVVEDEDEMDEDEMEDEDEMDEEEDDMALSGEGVLSKFEIEDEEDEVEEGAEDTPVMTLTLEAEDGDIEVDRLYFTLDANNSNTEEDAYDVFDEVSVWVDGDKVASFDASDEDEYRDEDDGTFIMSGLGLIVEEDEELEIVVAVSVAGTVRGSEADAAEWTLDVTEVRYFDADGVSDNDTTTDDLPGGETFDIVREGNDDDADIEGNSNTPDSATLEVEEDNDESDEYVVHIFDIEVDDESSDLELNDAYVWVTITNPTTTASTSITVDSVIADIYLTIDGETETGELAAGSSTAPILVGSSTRVGFLFEFDELMLESGDTYQAEVSMEFEGQDDWANYQNGVTIQTDVDGQSPAWEVEGANLDNVLTGTDVSETHTLSTVVPVIEDVDANVTVDDPNDSGTISFTFTISVDGENDLVDFGIADIVTSFTGTDVANAIGAGTLAEVSGDATPGSGAGLFNLDNGDEATFALDFPVATVDAGDNGTYRATIESILGVEVDVTSPGLSVSQ